MVVQLLPSPPVKYSAQWFALVLDLLRQSMARLVSSEEAAPRIILQSPNGTNYSVKVSDAGALVVTHNDGKTRP